MFSLGGSYKSQNCLHEVAGGSREGPKVACKKVKVAAISGRADEALDEVSQLGFCFPGCKTKAGGRMGRGLT